MRCDNSTKPLLGFQQAPRPFKELPNAYHFARKTTSFIAQTSDSSIKPSAGTVLGFQQSPRILRDLSKADQRWGSDETPIELDLTDGWWEKLIEFAGEIVPFSWKDKLKFWLDSRFGKRVKFQVVNGKEGCEVYLNIGGFGVDDIHVHLEGKYIHVTGKSENLGFELNVKKTYRIKRNMKFNPEKVTGYMQRGMLKIHLLSSPTSVKKTGIFKVYLKDLE